MPTPTRQPEQAKTPDLLLKLLKLQIYTHLLHHFDLEDLYFGGSGNPLSMRDPYFRAIQAKHSDVYWPAMAGPYGGINTEALPPKLGQEINTQQALETFVALALSTRGKAVVEISLINRINAEINLKTQDFSGIDFSSDGPFGPYFLLKDDSGKKRYHIDFADADFSNSDLNHARFDNLKMSDFSFNGCNLESASFRGAAIGDCGSIRHANCRNADFTAAVISPSDDLNGPPEEAMFYKTDFSGANFTRAKMNASFTECIFDDKTDFTGANFENAALKGLDLRGNIATIIENMKKGKNMHKTTDIPDVLKPVAAFHAMQERSISPGLQ